MVGVGGLGHGHGSAIHLVVQGVGDPALWTGLPAHSHLVVAAVRGSADVRGRADSWKSLRIKEREREIREIIKLKLRPPIFMMAVFC